MKTLILLFSVLFTTMSFAQAPSYVPANGLVGWWPFNGNANDESGNGNNGTVNGATLTIDRNGVANQAYSFDVNQKIGTFITNFPVYTVSIWAKINTWNLGIGTHNGGSLASHKSDGYYGNGWVLEHNGENQNQWCWLEYNGNNNNIQQYSGSPQLNTWYHVILTSDSQGIRKLYINGVLTDTYNGGAIISGGNNYEFKIGAHIDGPNTIWWFKGDLDDVGYWNRALAECEIQNLYTTSISAQPTGLSCWQTAIFNTTSCAWDVTGTQATQPTGLSCWQTASFNNTSCAWVVSGTQPIQPTLACYETATFNTTTCAWVISGPQAPQKMSYQAIIRNSNDSLLISTPVGMRISLVQGTPSGTVVFSETQTATTNANGLVSLQIGMGTAVSGTFACIDWAAGPYYVKTETDLAGGTNYTIISSNEILSVPYALFSANGIAPGTVAGEMNYWNGTAWVTVAPGSYANPQTLTFCMGVPTWGPCPWSIGQSYQGGIVAYILQPGDSGYDANVPHGLIAAPSDQEYAPWGCQGTEISGADGTAIGTGNQNTIDIMTGCSTAGIAASLCGDLVLNGYSDWYLPSLDELNKLYINRFAIGGFANNYYWSSTEGDNFLAWVQDFANGYQDYFGNKYFLNYVRAVRAF